MKLFVLPSNVCQRIPCNWGEKDYLEGKRTHSRHAFGSSLSAPDAQKQDVKGLNCTHLLCDNDYVSVSYLVATLTDSPTHWEMPWDLGCTPPEACTGVALTM